jgi:PKD repeat protein
MVDNGPGTANYGSCGSTSIADINAHTAVLSHELAETINDPLVADAGSVGPPLAWYDPVAGEIADKCDARPLANNGPWTVEQLWSNRDGQCEPSESAFSAPTANFLGASTVAPGAPASFDGSSSTDPAQNRTSVTYGTTYSISSGITSYQWNWGDGSSTAPSSGATAVHSYAAAGTYQVSLTVTDNLGFTSTVTHQLVVANGTTPPAPVLATAPASAVSAQTAVLNGSINPQSQTVQYKFVYGTSPGALNQSTPLTAGPTGASATPVSATLSGLSPSTTYYYELEAVGGGQTYIGSPAQSFTTTSAPPSTQQPVVATGGAAQVSFSTAVLTGAVNPNGPGSVTYQFSYGTSRAHLNATTPATTLAGGTASVPVGAPLTGLSPGSTYYFRLDVSLGGTVYSGRVNRFSTPVPRPSVSTGAASAITGSSAIVSGTVNPNGVRTYYLIEFGTTRGYGHSSVPVWAGSGTANVPVQATLTGLRARTSYHYRLVAISAGGAAVGTDSTFTTAAASARAPGFWFRPPRHPGRHKLRIRFSCDRACVAHFALTTVPPGLAAGAARSLTIASTTARLSGAGSGTATLTVRRRPALRPGQRLTVRIPAYADAPGSAPSPPQSVQITLT